MAVARAAAKAATGKAATSSVPPASSSTRTPPKTPSSPPPAPPKTTSSPSPPAARRPPGPAVNAAAGVMAHPTTESAAGVILGAMLWIWVGMPLIRGGPAQVKNVLRAKFFNKHADGSWLP